MIRSHFSAVMSSRGSKDSTPALVTRMPTGPSSARTRAKAASTDCRSATSTSTPRTRTPSSLHLGRRRFGARAVPVEDGDVVAVRHELAGDAEPDTRRAAGHDGDKAHRFSPAGVNSRCRSLSPRRTHVGSYR